MGKPSAPDPTPPRETSAASTGTNVSTAIANNIMGNVNTYGPDGSTVFDQNGEYTWTDPYTKQTYTIPKFDQTTTLSPTGQQIYDQTNGTKLNLATLANNQSSFLNDYMAQPFDYQKTALEEAALGPNAKGFSYNDNAHEKWAMDLYRKLNEDQNQQQLSTTQAQLADSGIKLGSDAYDRAVSNTEEAQNRARDQFLLDSYGQGFNTAKSTFDTNFNAGLGSFGANFGAAQATRNQPINEITALASGSQVAQPQSPGFQFNRIPTTDNAGIIANYDNQKMQAYQQEMAQRNSLLGGLFSLGSSFIGLSDKRAKKNIKKVGKKRIKGTKKTTDVVDFNYKGEPKGTPKHRGVIAQDIKKKKPSAVKQMPGGLFGVRYDKI